MKTIPTLPRVQFRCQYPPLSAERVSAGDIAHKFWLVACLDVVLYWREIELAVQGKCMDMMASRRQRHIDESLARDLPDVHCLVLFLIIRAPMGGVSAIL